MSMISPKNAADPDVFGPRYPRAACPTHRAHRAGDTCGWQRKRERLECQIS